MAEERKTTRFLSVRLTEEERDERRKEATSLVAKYGEVEEAKKESAANFACQLKSIRKNLDRCVTEANSGSAMRDVECVVRVEGGWRLTFRTDTMLEIEREPVPQAEMFN